MFATAGNLSFRSEISDNIWITASGKHKGNLSELDFVNIDLKSQAMLASSGGKDNKPSAETSIHNSIYKRLTSVHSVLHVHTLSSNLLSYLIKAEEKYRLIEIPNIEIIKAYGIWKQTPNLKMAVFFNFLDVSEIAKSIAQFLELTPNYELPFILVEGHGPTVWGSSIQEADRHLEATAFLFDVMRLGQK